MKTATNYKEMTSFLRWYNHCYIKAKKEPYAINGNDFEKIKQKFQTK